MAFIEKQLPRVTNTRTTQFAFKKDNMKRSCRRMRRAQLHVAKTRGLSHLSCPVISCSLQGLVYMQKSTWIRAAVLLVAVTQIAAYNTGLGSGFGVFFLLECKLGLAFPN